MKPLEAGDPTSVGAGRYRLTGRLGQGGMGVVYIGRSQSGRAVAVKVVRPELSTEPGFRRRFAEEVAAARRVGGFHTAPVVDADPEGEPAWLVTAYVPGPTLQDVLLSVGSLPLDTLTVLAAGLAEALEAIHRAGVVHRDLKPANIIVAEDGPRVIDFGIARAMDGTALTQTGWQVGTPGFLAPEQLMGGAITPAVDMFALGVVLCQAAGGAPFGDGPSAARHYRVVHEEPDLSGVPAQLRPAIAACLSKDAADRPTPSAFLDTLAVRPVPEGQWLPAEATALLPRAEPPGTGAPGSFGAGEGTTRRGAPEPGPTAPVTAAPPPVPENPYAAPDGSGPGPAYAPTVRAGFPQTPPGSFGPPGSAYGGGSGAPGTPPPPAPRPDSGGPARPPGRRRRASGAVALLVVLGAVAGVFVWQPWKSSPGSPAASPGKSSAGPSSASASAAKGPAALPAAPLLVRLDTQPGAADGCHSVIALRPAAADTPRRLVPGGTCDVLPSWSPDGSRFAFVRQTDAGKAVWVADSDGSGARRVGAVDGGRAAWGPDGTKLAVLRKKDGVTQLYLVSVADGSAQQITHGTQSLQDPAWSPDGTRIAVCLQTEPGLWQIHVVDLAHPDAAPRQITRGAVRALDPAWSPDGKLFAYTYGKPEVGTQGDIHLIGTDGTGDRPLAATADQEMDPVWSHDGTWVAYVRGAIDAPAVWAIRADGTGTRKLTTGNLPEGHPSWR